MSEFKYGDKVSVHGVGDWVYVAPHPVVPARSLVMEEPGYPSYHAYPYPDSVITRRVPEPAKDQVWRHTGDGVADVLSVAGGYVVYDVRDEATTLHRARTVESFKAVYTYVSG